MTAMHQPAQKSKMVDRSERGSTSLKWTLFSTLLYGFCSGSMNFLNKFVLSVWSFHEPSIIMFAQMLFLALGLYAVKRSKKVELVDYTPEKARTFIPLSLVYSVNTVISLSALTGMNIPMYNAVRRCIPIASLALGCCMLKKQKTTPNIVISVVIITAGTFIAAAGDLDFDIRGYFYGILSILLQALYLITLQRLEMDHKLGALSISYINSINCLPVMLVMVFVTGEYRSVLAFPHWSSPSFVLCFALLVLYGCLFTYSMFLCTTVNSALTTSLVGVAKSAITTIVGMYAFGGVTPTAMLVLGQIINLGGGMFYTYEKYRLNVLKKSMKSSASSIALNLSHDLKSDSDLHKLAQVKVDGADWKKRDEQLYGYQTDIRPSYTQTHYLNGDLQQHKKEDAFSSF